jgi:methionyl-tRNA formyltransferase
MVPALDAGPVIHQVVTPLAADEAYGELQLRLSELGALAIVEALALMQAGRAHPIEQDHSKATYARKIERDSARIDWSRSSTDVSRIIRAFDPRPGAWTVLHDSELKVFGGREAEGSGPPGTVLRVENGGIVIACGTGAVRAAWVHPAGRKRIRAADWVAGRGVAVGDVFDG